CQAAQESRIAAGSEPDRDARADPGQLSAHGRVVLATWGSEDFGGCFSQGGGTGGSYGGGCVAVSGESLRGRRKRSADCAGLRQKPAYPGTDWRGHLHFRTACDRGKSFARTARLLQPSVTRGEPLVRGRAAGLAVVRTEPQPHAASGRFDREDDR